MAISEQSFLTAQLRRFSYYRNVILCIIGSLARYDELERLVRWAKRKRLPGPHKAYVWRLTDEEQRLARFQSRYPRLFAFCELARVFIQQLTPSRRDYA